MTTEGPIERRNEVDADTRSQIRERLRWTPAQRLSYLKEMIEFEQRAAKARRVT
jgi:hypothetical protein